MPFKIKYKKGKVGSKYTTHITRKTFRTQSQAMIWGWKNVGKKLRGHSWNPIKIKKKK